jgi:hypothetical protein
MGSFEKINTYFNEKYGLSLFLREEPYLMANKRPQKWVGIADPNYALLKSNGSLTTKYPKNHGIILNGGHRCITLNTLRRNIEKGRELFTLVN